MMKKTLVVLALAAATVSGSVMAWEANGTGGKMELGGTLTPQANVTPWEVMIGASVTDLDAPIKTGSYTVDIPVKTPITVLGIRTVSNQTFMGTPGISPRINFNGAIDTTKFDTVKKGDVPMTLKITDDSGKDIGMLNTTLSASAVASYTGNWPNGTLNKHTALYAFNASSAFDGGLQATEAATSGTAAEAKTILNNINADFMANYNEQSTPSDNVPTYTSFHYPDVNFSAAYGSGIGTNKKITLTLNNQAGSDAIVWKASLPITVSYQ